MNRLLFILLLFAFASTQAQEALPAYPLRSDTTASLNLPDSFVRILPGADVRLSLVNVQAKASAFRNPAELSAKPAYPGVYWLHYKLQNVSANPMQIALASPAVYATFFSKRAGGPWVKQESGDYRAWSNKDGAKAESSIPFTLKPGETLEVYQRNHFWQQIPPHLHATVQFPKRLAAERYSREQIQPSSVQDNQLLSALIAGILLFAAIIYIRFFHIVEVLFYMHYALFLFCFSILYSPISLFFHRFPLVDVYLSNVAFGLGLFFFTQFFRSYLRTPANYRWWDKWLLVVSLLPLFFFFLNYVFIGLFPPAVYYYTLMWGGRTFVLVLDSLLVTALLYIATHKASAGVVATLPALVLWGVGQSYKLVYRILAPEYRTQHRSGLVQWINENSYLIDLVSIIWIVSVFSSLLFRRFQHLQKRVLKEAIKNERLKRQKEKERRELIARQKSELEQKVEERTAALKRANRELVVAMRNLKETQAQLVQKEKMASLGELTAGIAHEIQNPLNFINNFSELSAELVQEIDEALRQDNKGYAASVIKEIKESLGKIAHHGRRADAIVKGMLQHSRSSTGNKELTNINTLADEYLRLSFHGLRAKDKDFNAHFTTHFDETIEPIEIVPQEIGRVLLNLFNNAFYAVYEKKKQLNGTFEPTVSVTTKKRHGKIEIIVKDNGTGISPKVLDKIYQPFFTTKPTGEGTGLGLSLSYDIITKGHSGEMKVETTEGEGAEFKIFLPTGTNKVNSRTETK